MGLSSGLLTCHDIKFPPKQVMGEKEKEKESEKGLGVGRLSLQDESGHLFSLPSSYTITYATCVWSHRLALEQCGRRLHRPVNIRRWRLSRIILSLQRLSATPWSPWTSSFDPLTLGDFQSPSGFLSLALLPGNFL